MPDAADDDRSDRYGLGRRGVWILAVVARLESDYGRGMTAKQLAETGPMGLSADEWKRYGVDGDGDGLVRRDEPWDGIATFARMANQSFIDNAGSAAFNAGIKGTPTILIDGETFTGDPYSTGPLTEAVRAAAGDQ